MVGSFSLCYDVMLSGLINVAMRHPRRASQRPGCAPMGVSRKVKANSRSVEHGGIDVKLGPFKLRNSGWVCGDETKRDELRCDGSRFGPSSAPLELPCLFLVSAH